MTTVIRDLLDDLAAYEKTPEGVGHDLRLDLAEIILRHLDGKNWTQQKLAEAAGMKAPYLTRIIHGSQNCTFDVAGRILFALGVKAKLTELHEEIGALAAITADGHHGNPKIIAQEQTGSRAIAKSTSSGATAANPVLRHAS